MSGNCTRILASEILSKSIPQITSTSHILDSACGPGIVTQEIRRLHSDVKITAADLNPDMISEIQRHIQANDWSNIETKLLDSRNLETLEDGTFTHAISNLGLMGDDREGSVKAVSEMFRVLKAGGVAVLSTWADRVWPAAFLNTARIVRPDSTPQNLMAMSGDVLRGSWLMRVLEDGGFANNVQVTPMMTYTCASSMDELVENMLLARGMFFPSYSGEEMGRVKPIFEKELRKLRTFEELEDGGVRVGMKAWIGVGTKVGDEGEVPY